MKIVFMGTPQFSAAFLQHLATTEHEIVGVVTKPDQEMGRGRKIQAAPVKNAAVELNLPLLQPANLKDPEFLQELKAWQADLFVVVAFSLLPQVVLRCARLGAVNVHGSLLPKYRGAAPVQWAVADGLTETGVSVFLLDEKMDTGPLLTQKAVPIAPTHTTAEVLEAMIPIGCAALDDALAKLATGYTPLPQDHSLATAARKLSKEDGWVDWSLPAQVIYNRQRAFFPWPSTYSSLQGKKVVFHQFALVEKAPPLSPGHAQVDAQGRLIVGTGSGGLEIVVLQLEGKKALPATEVLRGLQGVKTLVFGAAHE